MTRVIRDSELVDQELDLKSRNSEKLIVDGSQDDTSKTQKKSIYNYMRKIRNRGHEQEQE